MDRCTFFHEDGKYSELWSDGYRQANWQRLARIALATARTYHQKPNLVDFGCGNGAALEFFNKKGISATGTDISTYAVETLRYKGYSIVHASLDCMPTLADDAFSIGFCNDVLEHVPEPYVSASLDEMTRVCSDYLFVSVCPTLARNRSKEGENLHLTVRPSEWWEHQLEGYGNLKPIRFMFSRSLRYAIDLRNANSAER